MFYNCHIASVYNGLNFGFYSTHASNYFCNANFIYSGVTEITIFPPYGSNNPDPDNYSYSLECNNAWSNIDDMFTNFKVSGTVNISFRKDVPLGSGELARSNVTNINCSCLNLYINGTNIDFTGFQFITNTYRRIYIRDTFNLSQLKSAGYITGSYAYNNINSSAY